MSIYDNIAKNIQLLIEEKNSNALSISKSLNISSSIISRFLKREISTINLDLLLKIADYFNVPFEWFFKNNNSLTLFSKSDETLSQMIEWIKYTYNNADDDMKGWFHVEMKRKFPEYEEWLNKRDKKREDDRKTA